MHLNIMAAKFLGSYKLMKKRKCTHGNCVEAINKIKLVLCCVHKYRDIIYHRRDTIRSMSKSNSTFYFR